jgi:hypothetical protein
VTARNGSRLSLALEVRQARLRGFAERGNRLLALLEPHTLGTEGEQLRDVLARLREADPDAYAEACTLIERQAAEGGPRPDQRQPGRRA